MTAVIHPGGHVAGHHDEHHGAPHGWRRWVYATNHKDIGTMYLIFAVMAGIIGTAFSVWFRLELQEPGRQGGQPFLDLRAERRQQLGVLGPGHRGHPTRNRWIAACSSPASPSSWPAAVT